MGGAVRIGFDLDAGGGVNNQGTVFSLAVVGLGPFVETQTTIEEVGEHP